MHSCDHMHLSPEAETANFGRRNFIKLATMASGAALFAQVRPAHAGAAEALVLSCMDYRLADDTHKLLDGMGLNGKYDHVVLAGASAGVLHDAFAGWHDTFWDHLDTAIQLHAVRKVIVIDHRDCGAYKIAFGPEHAADRATETKLHSEMLAVFEATLKTRKPDLEFEGYLLDLDGTAEKLV